MKVKKKFLKQLGLFLFIIITIIWTVIHVQEYKKKDEVFCGTVVKIQPPAGHMISYQVLINWDEYGLSTINGGTIFNYEEGDRYCTKATYCFILGGRSGTAYVPGNAVLPIPILMFMFLLNVLIFIILIFLILKKIEIVD
ncbi:MAG TPA: hypothetical protein VKN82_02215 [Desulfohalobiaceae bacterium]|nr:hypothetical protein [Desulfohalobiaceae bacterium]